MTSHTRKIDMVFNYVKLGTDIRGTIQELGFTVEHVAILSGVSDTTVSGLMTNNEPNPKINTFLGVCNALDLNPQDYFELRG